MTKTILSKSPDETYALAAEIAEKLHGGEVLLLHGELGAGKTTFTKGLAKALGVDKTVKSPTFTIMKTYYGRLTLRHFDMYRIGNEDEVEELGLKDELFGGDVCVIEWNKFTVLPEKTYSITFEYAENNVRKITVEGLL